MAAQRKVPGALNVFPTCRPVFGPGLTPNMSEREIRRTSPNLDPSVQSGEKWGLAFSAVQGRNRSAQYGRRWDNCTKTVPPSPPPSTHTHVPQKTADFGNEESASGG